MKLRKFMIFFVLIFFMLSTNVFSSSIFDIEIITHLPYDAEDNNYIIGYSHYSQSVFIAVYRSSRSIKSFHVTENGVYDESGNLLNMFYRTYNSDEKRWSSIAVYDKDAPWFVEGGLEPLLNKMSICGQIYIFGRKYIVI